MYAAWYPVSDVGFVRSSGRNRMLQYATRDGLKHDYYVFCDDDITLTYAADQNETQFVSPFRAFEHYLSSHLPAVSAPSYPSWGPSPKPGMLVQVLRSCPAKKLSWHLYFGFDRFV